MKPNTQASVERFFKDYTLKHYKKGHIFILPDEPIEFIYYLVEGKVRVYDVSYRGDEIIINSRKAPGFFPLALVTPSAVNRYIYEADSDVAIQQAPIHDIEHFLTTHPQVVLGLLSYIYIVLDSVLERMVHFVASSAKSRLLYTLITECRDFGEQVHNNCYQITITERELGARAGLSRETVSREAALLKRLKLIEIQHSTIVIRDLHKLEALLKSHS